MGMTRLPALFVLLVALSLVSCSPPSTPPAQQSTAAALASTPTSPPAPSSTTTVPTPSPTVLASPTLAGPLATPAIGYATPLTTPATGYASPSAMPGVTGGTLLATPLATAGAGPLTTPLPTAGTGLLVTPLPTAVTIPLATPLATAGTSPLLTSAAPEAYSPIPQAQCNTLEGLVSQTLGKPATTSQAPFRDPVSGASGTGCEITMTGTGRDFANFSAVIDQLEVPLRGLGWTEDPAGRADGPTGTARLLRQGNTAALVGVIWHPSPDANCPPNQPISACQLRPEQQLYTITINLAQRSAP